MCMCVCTYQMCRNMCGHEYIYIFPQPAIREDTLCSSICKTQKLTTYQVRIYCKELLSCRSHPLTTMHLNLKRMIHKLHISHTLRCTFSSSSLKPRYVLQLMACQSLTSSAFFLLSFLVVHKIMVCITISIILVFMKIWQF